MRLQDRVAMVVGAGQSPGETMGNGRATALVFALVMHWWIFAVQGLSALWFFLADEVRVGEVFAYSRRSQMP